MDYWVTLGCFRNIGIGISIVKGFSKYWYRVLLRAFQSIGNGIGYCLSHFKTLILVLGIVKALKTIGNGIGY